MKDSVGHVSDLEANHGGDEVERHGRDLPGVKVVVAYRQAADHHV